MYEAECTFVWCDLSFPLGAPALDSRLCRPKAWTWLVFLLPTSLL